MGEDIIRGTDSDYKPQAGAPNTGTGAFDGGTIDVPPTTTSQTEINWEVIDTFKNQTGLRNAIKDFIDTNENGVKLQRDFVNGRQKSFTFNFKHTPSPIDTEVGIFKLILKYPSDLTANDNMADSDEGTTASSSAPTINFL